MKTLLWMPALALCAVACLTACDDSSSSKSAANVPTYKNTAALPDSCEMEAAKVDTVYYACFENEWIAVMDSATIEKIKDGLNDEDLKKELQDLQEMLSSAAAQKADKKSSSSAAVDDEGEENDVESSSEGASEGKEDSSSSSEKKSGESSSAKGDNESSSAKGDDESSSSEGDDESSSSEGDVGSSSANGDVESSSSATVEYKCGTVSYDPETQVCEEGNVIKGKCGTVTYDLDGTKTCVNNVVKGVCGSATYDLDGTKTCVGNVVKGVCGSSTYELDGSQTCVNNVVKGVCGSATYDLNGTRTCENGVLKGLCDGVSYDLQTRTCQYGVIVGLCGTATYDLSTEACVSGVVKGKCGSTTYNQETQGCCGSTVYNFDEQICNYNNELLNYCGNNLYNKNTQVCRTRDGAVINNANVGNCGSDIYDTGNEICDSRNSSYQVYRTVKIGYGRAVLQTWLAENMRYNVSGSLCPGGNSSNCDKYGRLYTWSAANNSVCPSGWRLPTGSDFETLIVNADTMITSYSQNRQSGANLKGGEGWSNYRFDMYGFTALPAGYATSTPSYNGFGSRAYFWSSSTYGTGANNAYYMVLADEFDTAGIEHMSAYNYASVRCIKN